jgi:hypothetical protein
VTKTSSGFITRQKREALRMLHTPKMLFLFALQPGANFAPVPGLGAGVSSALVAGPCPTPRRVCVYTMNRDRLASTAVSRVKQFMSRVGSWPVLR